MNNEVLVDLLEYKWTYHVEIPFGNQTRLDGKSSKDCAWMGISFTKMTDFPDFPCLIKPEGNWFAHPVWLVVLFQRSSQIIKRPEDSEQQGYMKTKTATKIFHFWLGDRRQGTKLQGQPKTKLTVTDPGSESQSPPRSPRHLEVVWPS